MSALLAAMKATLSAQVYQSHRQKLITYARSRGCGPQDAEDVVQDVFASLLRLGRLEELWDLHSGEQYALLCCRVRSLVTNRWRDRHRQRRDEAQVVPFAEVEHQVLSLTNTETPVTALNRAWALGEIEHALQTLRGESRGARMLGIEEALRGEALPAAARLGQQTSLFRVTLHRARKRLRAMISSADLHAALCAA